MYSQTYPEYREQGLSLGRAIHRATHFQIDSDTVPPLPPQALPLPLAGRNSDITRYPSYRIPYAPDTGMYAQRLPQRVPDQHMNTSTHTYERFDVGDLPALLFRIEPIEDLVDGIEPPDLLDAATGRQVINSRGERLRYFSFLPRYISQQVSGALLEFWFRLDYNLEPNDILMRMERSLGAPIPSNNAVNMRRIRFRDRTAQNAWQSSREWPARTEIELLDTLTPLQICLNTTMKVDLANSRFLKPVYSDEMCSNCEGHIDAGVPLDYFLRSSAVPVPSKRMLACIALRQRLQDLSVIQGVGLTRDRLNWRVLQVRDLPACWNSRAAAGEGRAIDELPDGLSHEQMLVRDFDSLIPVIARRMATRRRR